jgi:hypothetical protein
MCQKKLKRLMIILKTREQWREQITSLKHMRQWVFEVEHILDGSWADFSEKEEIKLNSSKRSKSYRKQQQEKKRRVTNKEVSEKYDHWREDIGKNLEEGILSQNEHKQLEDFLKVLDRARPFLINCYDIPDFPRTNNDTERAIRSMKTSYRRMTGRKNWNAYLLRYGRYVAFYEWWGKDQKRWQQLMLFAKTIDKDSYKLLRKESKKSRNGQINRFRFHHQPEKYLQSLEDRWNALTVHTASATITQTASLR